MKRTVVFGISVLSVICVLILSVGAQKPAPKVVQGGVLNGKAMSLPKPAYPDAARAVKASGSVTVKVLIDENGNVISAEATSGHPLLRAAAVNAARSAKFSPTLLSGQPVKVSGVITYNFIPDASPRLAEKGFLSGVPSSDRDKLWAFGLFFSLLQVADAETIRMIGDEKEFNDMLKDFSTDLPAEETEYRPILEKVASPDFAIRSEASREFLRMVRKEFNAEQNWQVDVGEQIGLLLGEMLRQKMVYVKTGVAFDANVLRTYLERLSDLVTTAPMDVPAESKERFRKIASFRDATDLATDRKISEMMDAISPLFDELDDN